MAVYLTDEGERQLWQEYNRIALITATLEADLQELIRQLGVTPQELATLLREQADFLDPQADAPRYTLIDPLDLRDAAVEGGG